MYINDISSQLQVFLYSVGFGFILGIIYDIFKLFRLLIIKNNRAVPIQDIAFFLLCAILAFVFLLVVNNGIFRFNILVALVAGFTVYYLTLGRFSVHLTISFIKNVKLIINSLARVITAPCFLILSLFKKTNIKLPEKFINIKFSRKKAKKTLENKE